MNISASLACLTRSCKNSTSSTAHYRCRQFWRCFINDVQPLKPLCLVRAFLSHRDVSEIHPILTEARDKADAEEWGYKDTGRDIPEMGIRLGVTKMHGQDTTVLAAGHRL